MIWAGGGDRTSALGFLAAILRYLGFEPGVGFLSAA